MSSISDAVLAFIQLAYLLYSFSNVDVSFLANLILRSGSPPSGSPIELLTWGHSRRIQYEMLLCLDAAVTLMSVQWTCQMLVHCSTKAWRVAICPSLLAGRHVFTDWGEEEVGPPGDQCWYLLMCCINPVHMMVPGCHEKLTAVPCSKARTVSEC